MRFVTRGIRDFARVLSDDSGVQTVGRFVQVGDGPVVRTKIVRTDLLFSPVVQIQREFFQSESHSKE